MSYEQQCRDKSVGALLAETSVASQEANQGAPWADYRFLTVCGVLLETLDAGQYCNEVAVPFPFGRVREGLRERVAA